MAVDTDFIRNIAPELSGETNARIILFIGFAALQVNASAWADKSDLATGLLACHMISLANRQGKGQVTAEKVGDLQVNYASIPPAAQGQDDELLKQTPYGSMFLELRKGLVLGPLILR